MPDEQERAIGRLEARVERLQADVHAMDQKLDEIRALVDQAKGAKWAAAFSAAVIGAAASSIAWAAGLFKGD